MSIHAKILTPAELLALAADTGIISDVDIISLDARLMSKPVRQMTFVELRALQLLNSDGIGLSALIERTIEVKRVHGGL